MPSTSIRTTKELAAYLNAFENKNSLIIQLLTMLKNDQLPIKITQGKGEIKLTIEETDLDNLKTEKTKVQIENIRARTKLTNIRSDFLQTFGKELPQGYELSLIHISEPTRPY